MMFTGLILILIGAIVFFHYLQGFFSATLSAILTVVAAVFAFSYHETVAESLLAGKVNDMGAGITLLVMFALIYLILRIIFDAVIPGNVRVPVAVDKAGAAIMGLVAGIFATGVVAVAAQELPFGPDIAGFTRFDVTSNRPAKVDEQGRGIMSATWDELTAKTPGEFDDSGQPGHGVPIVPVDDILVGLVNRLSGPSGSLDNGKPLTSIHPDFLDETFGQRLGIETTGGHVSVNSTSQHIDNVKVLGLYKLDPNIKQLDGEYETIRGTGNALKPVKLKANEMFLVVRALVAQSAADKDSIFRFSPASCRLVVDRPEGVGDQPGPADLYPIGTLQGTDTLYLNKIDDFLMLDMKAPKAADLVYVVDKRIWDTPTHQAPAGTFFEMKRMARVDLAGEKVEPTVTADPQVDVMRKYYILHPEENPELPQTPRAPTPSRNAPAPSAPAPQPGPRQPRGTPQGQAMQSRTSQSEATHSIPGGLFAVDRAESTTHLGFAMAVPGGTKEGELQKVGNGTVTIVDGKMKTASFDVPIHDIPRGRSITEFVIPPGQMMIRVSGNPPASQTFAFLTEPDQYELVDSQGKHYQPNGYFFEYGAGAGGLHMRVQYLDSTTISGGAPPDGATGVAELKLFYNVPTGVTITDFFDHGQKAAALRVQKSE